MERALPLCERKPSKQPHLGRSPRCVFGARPTFCARLFMKLIRQMKNGTISPIWPTQMRSLGKRSNTPPAIILSIIVPTSTP